VAFRGERKQARDSSHDPVRGCSFASFPKIGVELVDIGTGDSADFLGPK
jgi:hypothetical protein